MSTKIIDGTIIGEVRHNAGVIYCVYIWFINIPSALITPWNDGNQKKWFVMLVCSVYIWCVNTATQPANPHTEPTSHVWPGHLGDSVKWSNIPPIKHARTGPISARFWHIMACLQGIYPYKISSVLETSRIGPTLLAPGRYRFSSGTWWHVHTESISYRIYTQLRFVLFLVM